MAISKFTLDQLFSELRNAAMAEFHAVGTRALSTQAAATDWEGVVIDEIVKRPGHEERFREMLDDPHPRMRFRAALQMKAIDPQAALRVFRALSDANRACCADAYIQIGILRRQGIT